MKVIFNFYRYFFKKKKWFFYDKQIQNSLYFSKKSLKNMGDVSDFKA